MEGNGQRDSRFSLNPGRVEGFPTDATLQYTGQLVFLWCRRCSRLLQTNPESQAESFKRTARLREQAAHSGQVEG